MKKLGVFALLLSLGLLTFGCTQSDNSAPIENGAAPAETAPADMPAEDATPPEQG